MLTLYYGIACVSWKSLPVILFNTMASTCLSYRLFSLSMSHKPVLTMRSRTLLLSHFSRVWLFETLWTVACQAPLYMGILQAEYWSGLPCPPPGDLPNLEMEPTSLMPCSSPDLLLQGDVSGEERMLYPAFCHACSGSPWTAWLSYLITPLPC